MRRPSSNAFLIAAALVAASGMALAKSSDRNQTMSLEYDWSDCSLGSNMSCEMRGNIVITQGTLKINASQGNFNQSGGRPSKAHLSGGVTMSQQLDDGTPVNTKSSTVDYDFSTEIVILTGGVVINQPRGSLRGERVVYNMRTGQVQSGGQGNGRERMTIQPKTGGN